MFSLIQKNWLFVFLFLLAFFSLYIQFFHSFYFAVYNAEVAQHYLEIIKLLKGQILLQGPLTSHEWFRLSATPYYFFFPLFAATKFHPLTLPFLWNVFSALIIPINYLVINKSIDRKTATISSFILAFCPNILLMNRIAGFWNFILPLTYLLILFTHQVIEENSRQIWPIFLVISVMFTLHATAIVLLPFYLILLMMQKKFSLQQIGYSTLAFITPQLPFLLEDSFHGFSMSSHFLLWIPYKFFNFLTGKSLGVERSVINDQTFSFIITFFKQSLFSPTAPLLLGVVIMIVMILYFIFRKESYFVRCLFALLFFGMLSLLIHKNPPIHYFAPFVVLVPILMSRMLTQLANTPLHKINLLFVLLFIFLFNFRWMFSPAFLFQDLGINAYATQKQVALFIHDDAHQQPFSLWRIGEFDYYPNQFKDNYQFLLWWMGDEVKENAAQQYLIVEDAQRVKEAPQFTERSFTPLTVINGVQVWRSRE